jgi:serine/threonine protein kinase
MNEMFIMKRANHSCTVEWIGAYIEQKRVLWVIMEYMDCGSLADVLENHGELFMSEAQIAIVMRDVCSETNHAPAYSYTLLSCPILLSSLALCSLSVILTARWARRFIACMR